MRPPAKAASSSCPMPLRNSITTTGAVYGGRDTIPNDDRVPSLDGDHALRGHRGRP